MSMYREYLEELGSRDIVESENGFATYLITGKECYIEDIYVKKEFRKTKEASKLADKIVKIAKEKGCTLLTGSVVPTANNSTRSLKVLLGYGFKLHSANDNFIVFSKEL